MTRRVMILTTKRGGSDALRPLFRLLIDSPETDLRIIVSDMHMMPYFGKTVDDLYDLRKYTKEIRPMYAGVSGPYERMQNVGMFTVHFAEQVRVYKPDILVVYGDRAEMLAAAMVASQLYIPVAHLQAGDTSGTVDDRTRHAISRLSTMLFASSPDAVDTLRALGEPPGCIYQVGDHHVDRIIAKDYVYWKQAFEAYGLDPGALLSVVLYHPDNDSGDDPAETTRNCIDAALSYTGDNTLVIYPCNDPGWDEVVNTIKSYGNRVRAVPNIPSTYFLAILSRAQFLLGNSSCGIIEAPYLGVPAINVGRRQQGRLRCGNVVDCTGDFKSIVEAIQRSKNLRGPYREEYGDGTASQRTFHYLTEVNLESVRSKRYML